MYHLTVTSVRSFMHVTRADHVQTKRNPFSSCIYMHVYMSEQSITGKMATIQSGIIHLSANRMLSEIPGLPRPQTYMYKKSCVQWMITFCLDRTMLKTIYFGIRREEKKPTEPKHASYIIYIYIYFSCKYNFVFKLVE